VLGRLLITAKARIKKAHCRVGTVTYKPSTRLKKNRILSELPRPGRRLKNGAKVNVTVGRGRR